ncbi:hypothetical protein GGS20DRAFT_579185 [Poronia punctata]|nr:hypothetical protein GGS20DRAFT_579185 [Poronia punctata]
MGFKTLSTWNQMAPRVYTGHCFCFPYLPNGNAQALESHLRTTLDALASRVPLLRHVIKPHPDHPDKIVLVPSGDDAPAIPLKVTDERRSFGWTYRQLQSRSFPAQAFVGNAFELPPSLPTPDRGVPLFGVDAKLIEGGLLIVNRLHHSVADGVGRTAITNAFASLTRDPSAQVPPIDIDADISPAAEPDLPAAELMAQTPEYRLLDAPYGPTIPYLGPPGPPFGSIRRTGRTFVVAPHALAQLRQQLTGNSGAKPPSSFTSLAALTWAHATKARLSAIEGSAAATVDSNTNTGAAQSIAEDGSEYWEQGKGKGETARIVTVVNWRGRAFKNVPELTATAGNAVAIPAADVALGTVLAAAGHHKDANGSGIEALRAVAQAIEASARTVDDGFVATRTALARRIHDLRFLGIEGDPREAKAFAFNTWRHLYTETPGWVLPGVPQQGDDGVQPDAVRRSQKEWDMGYGFILPQRKGFDGLEVLVTLEPEAMDALVADKSWRSWMKEVIE